MKPLSNFFSHNGIFKYQNWSHVRSLVLLWECTIHWRTTTTSHNFFSIDTTLVKWWHTGPEHHLNQDHIREAKPSFLWAIGDGCFSPTLLLHCYILVKNEWIWGGCRGWTYGRSWHVTLTMSDGVNYSLDDPATLWLVILADWAANTIASCSHAFS